MDEGPPQQVVAIVLAGGDGSDPLARDAGVASKSLVEYRGKPLAAHVLEALAASRSVARAVYVGRGDHRTEALADRAIPGGGRFIDSLSLGLGAALGDGEPDALLVVTADLPWLTPEAVDRFVRAASGSDLAYPVVPEHSALAAFPDQKRTFVRLRQGRFTGGNLMLLRPALVGALLEVMDRAYRQRKNPLALARLVGPGTLLAFLVGRADIPRIERLVSRRLGGRATVIVSGDACLAADVDRTEHLHDAAAGEP